MKNTAVWLISLMTIIPATQLFGSQVLASNLSSMLIQQDQSYIIPDLIVDIIAGGPPNNTTDSFSFTTLNYVVKIYTQGGTTYISVSDRKTGVWLNNIPVSVTNISGGRIYSLLKGETNVKVYRSFTDNTASIVVGNNRPESIIDPNNKNNSYQDNFAFFTKTYLVKIYTINGQTYMDVNKRDSNNQWINRTKVTVTSSADGWLYIPAGNETSVKIFKSRYSNTATIQVGNEKPESSI